MSTVLAVWGCRGLLRRRRRELEIQPRPCAVAREPDSTDDGEIHGVEESYLAQGARGSAKSEARLL
eukprot:15460849-Alexandrium_andersonii.AAC.1